jgi:hypothetical protein
MRLVQGGIYGAVGENSFGAMFLFCEMITLMQKLGSETSERYMNFCRIASI